jgi:predicted acylesterase/phospholipase RssA
MSSIPEVKKFCDLIMKGGITSGVIYPRLVAELAKTHTLKSIGGTSAGAIAAAGAAAAEYGRARNVKVPNADSKTGQQTSLNPFEKLNELPTELGELITPTQSRLLSFFRPQTATKLPFDLLLIGIDKKTSITNRLFRASLLLFKDHWKAFFLVPICLALIASLGFLILKFFLGTFLTVILLLAVLFCSIGLLASLFYMTIGLVQNLTKQNFGIASGMPPEDAKPSDPPTLTPWLANYFNTLSGKVNEKPLTFGDLWGPATDARPAKTEIDFQAITTCLSLGRPYSLPLEDKDFYYSKSEWEKLFPLDIMRWLLANERSSSTAKQLRQENHDLYAMPLQKDWPVIIAVRMSLSFPVLLAAIPMYRIDRSISANQNSNDKNAAPLIPIKVLFTDGGVSSNFPIHLFDSPFPSRPTFAVDLQKFPPKLTDPKEQDEKRVFTFIGNKSGHQQKIYEIPEGKPFSQLRWFGDRIMDSMQNWRDQLPKTMPGYRDRIAYVQHTETEGGLNLNMDKSVIETLANSGAKAAKELNHAFYSKHEDYNDQTGWQNHQWIRMRSSLKVLDQLVKSLGEKIESTYLALPDQPAPSYAFGNEANGPSPNQIKAVEFLKAVEELAETMKTMQGNLDKGAPESKLNYRISPDW